MNKNTILVNIHTASNINGIKASDNIITLLENVKAKYSNYTVVLGGDSNIYYGKITKNDKSGVSDINYFYNKLNKLDYRLIVSRHVVAKYRPYNFFQNAQSATKGGDWTNEETMIIAFPSKIKFNYDKDNYIEVIRPLKITDFHKNYVYGFIGTKINNKGTIDKITYKNFAKKLYSDHMPIFVDLNIDNLNYRIIFSNNLSINTNRGVNHNTNLFQIQSANELEKLSQTTIADFFINELEHLYKKLNVKFDVNRQNKLKYLKYLLMLDLQNINILHKKKSKKVSKKNNKNKHKNKKTLFQKHWNNKNNCTSNR